MLALALAVWAFRLARSGTGKANGQALLTPLNVRRVPNQPRTREIFLAAYVRIIGRLRALTNYPTALGAFTVALPCGALWAALALASGTGSVLHGATLMGAFAASSGLGLVMLTLGRQPLLRLRRQLPVRVVATLLALTAVFVALRPLPLLLTDKATCHSTHK